jgi:hypothetical protein
VIRDEAADADDAVMRLVLEPTVAPRLAGLARYRPEFDAAI